jgi:hypothetical protein
VAYIADDNLAPAANIHLVRFGSDEGAPWEVVGTEDTDLTLEAPPYGSVVGDTVTVSGTISGVDESVRVEVRQPSSAAPIGSYCCVSIGGQREPWEATVGIDGASDPALTIVASTGGHLYDVERFAITAVIPG